MSIYSPAGRKRIVKKFTNRQGLLILVVAALVSILLLWLMLSGYVGVDTWVLPDDGNGLSWSNVVTRSAVFFA
jgi:hypothetical protein